MCGSFSSKSGFLQHWRAFAVHMPRRRASDLYTLEQKNQLENRVSHSSLMSLQDVPVTHVLYLHGFRSSPLSNKAQQMARAVAAKSPNTVWYCPQLPASPNLAMRELADQIAQWPRANMAVIGSSLGGFYATYLAEKLGCKCAVLNPAIDAARDLTRAIGEHTLWHIPSESFHFKAEYVDELRALQVRNITRPDRYYAVIAKGDEVLDWREMSVHYLGSPGVIQEGGDHAISNFDEHLPGILAFLNLAS